MAQTIIQVDAFTNKAFGGNPAAVCVLPQAADEKWMQQVALEMNLAETAFLYRQDDGYNLRWFTPEMEMPLCGHATLATAHVLWETGQLQPDQTANFYTKSGLLTANRRGNWIELNFPERIAEATEPPNGLLESLGIEKTLYVGKAQAYYLVEVESEEIIYNLKPDFSALKKVEDMHGVIVTSRGTDEYDFVSRFFAPAAGIDEDPVTGSAHCVLAPYWKNRLGKSEFLAFQASKRGGVLQVKVQGDRILLIGQAVTTLRGELVNI